MEKTTIYYFSGTGNSLKVALELGKQLQNCEVVPIAKCIKNNNYKVDGTRVGFVFPLYYLGLPKMVAEFIKNIDISSADYIFGVVTRGWPVVGGAIKQLKMLMKAKGKKLDFGTYIHMPMNDFTLAKVASKESQKKTLGKVAECITEITGKISKSERHYDFEPISFMLNKRNDPFVRRVNQLDRSYKANNLCTGCAICEKVCPAENISIKDGTPRWNNKCQLCLACFHYCPQKAIVYDGKCEDIPRYHHPDVSAAQIMSQKQ